ncbi:MAG: glycosyltransferase family 39 protein [Alphaproteobacteria bacterium]|nr:glycosyltransferase family 39 protein [Alphaproteobacteria bacterium]
MLITTLPDKTYRNIAWAFMAVLFLIVCATFEHYGITWDEEIQNQYGEAVYDFYASGLRDRHYEQIFNLYLYGGMFDGVAAFVNQFTPFHIFETRHLLNALLGLVGIWGTWRLGRLVAGGFTGLVAMAMLALTPMYYGHMFNNPKDIPFAVGVIWTLYYMVKIFMRYPRLHWPSIVKLGLVFGLTLGVRVNGIMILGHFGFVLGIMALAEVKKQMTLRAFAKELRRGLAVFVPVALLSYGVMLFCWPWAQEAPLANPIRAIMEFSNFPQNVEVLLGGTIYRSAELPWYYVPAYLFAQLPLLHLLTMLAGLFMLTEIFLRLRKAGKRAAVALCFLTVFFPVLYAIFTKPALYDAVRHFLFILPPLCLLGALVIRRIVRAVFEPTDPPVRGSIRLVTGIVLLTLVFFPLYGMIRLHPYEYIYINVLNGGVRGGYSDYEMDYWSSSFKEASEELLAYIEHTGTKPKDGGNIFKLAICGSHEAATLYLPPTIQGVDSEADADFFLATTRWQCQDMRNGHEIIRIQRMGVPLSIIKDVRFFPPVESNFPPQDETTPREAKEAPLGEDDWQADHATEEEAHEEIVP